MKQVATEVGRAPRAASRSGASRRRARLSRTITIRPDSVALVLSLREAFALRRFCNVCSPEEFRDARELGAFQRARSKLSDATPLHEPEEEWIGDDAEE